MAEGSSACTEELIAVCTGFQATHITESTNAGLAVTRALQVSLVWVKPGSMCVCGEEVSQGSGGGGFLYKVCCLLPVTPVYVCSSMHILKTVSR